MLNSAIASRCREVPRWRCAERLRTKTREQVLWNQHVRAGLTGARGPRSPKATAGSAEEKNFCSLARDERSEYRQQGASAILCMARDYQITK